MNPRFFLLVLAAVVAILAAVCLLSGGGEACEEEKYDGVHMCSVCLRNKATAAARESGAPTASPATATPTSVPSESVESGQPQARLLFAQNDARWGREEYDHGTRQDVGCGQTIAECGCAMTSVATVLGIFQQLTTPSGAALNPSSLNSWFNEGAQLTRAGWVSQGYSYGNVVWTAVNNFASAATGSGASVRFKGWAPADFNLIRAELRSGNPVVLEVPGHFIAAVDLAGTPSETGNDIIINDPFYKERTTLASYWDAAGNRTRVRSARLFEASQDLRGLVITVPADNRVIVTDSQNRSVGTVAGGNPLAAQRGAKADIPGSSYRFEEAWRDPSCTEQAPAEGAGVNTIFIPQPQSGAYNVRVFDPNGNETSAVVYAYDVNGVLKSESRDGGKDLRFTFVYDSGIPGQRQVPGGGTPTPTPTSAATETPSPTATQGTGPTTTIIITTTPGPGVTAQPPGNGGPGTTSDGGSGGQPQPGGGSPAPGDEPVSPTATEVPITIITVTPTPPPPQAMVPSQITVSLVESAVAAPGAVATTCRTDLSWTVGGDANGKVELLRNGVVIANPPLGAGTYSDPFSPGTWTYQVRATNSRSTPFLSDPVTVTPICLASFAVSRDVLNCAYNINWLVQGNRAGTVILTRALPGEGGPDVRAIFSEPIVAGQERQFIDYEDVYIARDYVLVVDLDTPDIVTPAIHLEAISSCSPFTSTVITSDDPDASIVGQQITVRYLVTNDPPGVGTPTGNVTVRDYLSLGDGVFVPGPTCTASVAAGQCFMTLTNAGTHSLTAQYTPDTPRFVGGTSSPVSHTVNQAGTTTAIGPDSPDPTVSGQAFNVPYSVSSVALGAGTPTGTVTVTASPSGLSCVGSVAAGQCSLVLFPPECDDEFCDNSQSLTATYSGDANFLSSMSAAIQHTANAAATTISITGHNPTSTVVGQPYSISAAVAVVAPGSGTPSGTVTVNDLSGGFCSFALPVSGTGSCQLTSVTAGMKTVVVSFSPNNSRYDFATTNTSHSVTPANTTTTITGFSTVSISPSITRTFVQVTASSPSAAIPTGTVIVSQGSLSCSLTLSGGTGSCDITNLNTLCGTTTATFQANSNFNSSQFTAPPSASCPG